jgi:hypothetical protein
MSQIHTLLLQTPSQKVAQMIISDGSAESHRMSEASQAGCGIGGAATDGQLDRSAAGRVAGTGNHGNLLGDEIHHHGAEAEDLLTHIDSSVRFLGSADVKNGSAPDQCRPVIPGYFLLSAC